MEGYRDIRVQPWNGDQRPGQNSGILLGWDNQEKKDVEVNYRTDSNRFFDYPYTGAVYPLDRMHFWKPKS